MNFMRHELKYYLSHIQTERLLRQLACFMDLDSNCRGLSGYRVRSLYFDSIDDECLFEKQSGFLQRKKFRLRIYGDDGTHKVNFEIKNKNGQFVKKESVTLSRDEARKICAGNHAVLLDKHDPVADQIYAIFAAGAYKPKVIVEYQRVAFVMPFSNIRVTLDQNLRSNINHLDLFSATRDTMPVIFEGRQILEVKYDHFCPGHLKRMLAGVNAERMAISKYTLARRFHKIQKWEDN